MTITFRPEIKCSFCGAEHPKDGLATVESIIDGEGYKGPSPGMLILLPSLVVTICLPCARRTHEALEALRRV